VNQPPYPLVSSGRRPSAGPEPQSARPSFSRRPAAGLIVIGVAAALMLSPAIVAVLSVTMAGRFDQLGIQSTVPFHLVPIFESGRVLITAALATKVMRATELE
jgi:hypothetical protein